MRFDSVLTLFSGGFYALTHDFGNTFDRELSVDVILQLDQAMHRVGWRSQRRG